MNGWTCINPVLTKYREIHVSYIIKMMQNVHKCIFAQTSQWIPNNAHNDIFGEDKVFLRFVGVLFIKQWSVHLQSKHPWIRVCIHATDDLFHLHVFISCILGYSSNPELFLFLFASFLLFLETRAKFEDTIKGVLLYPAGDSHLTTSQLFSLFSMLQCI